MPADRIGDPTVSVVMVSYGAWPLTERAIAALREHTTREFELVLVDNGSDPQTRAAVAAVPGAQVIMHEDNLGFGPATNDGAARARGHYLALLNTDAFVHAGWLEPLCATLELDGVGAVVPRLLHEDGSLQDAGTLVARDGTVRVYGDADDPERLCYRFRRAVDLGSAACMLIRRESFAQLGGFDALFSPAYYEDADLCLRLAAQGLKTVYEPRSSVTHVRYGSGRLDAAIELSNRNRELFAERWHARLAGRPLTFAAASEQAVMIARDAGSTPRVLICAPEADSSAAALGDHVLRHWPPARVTWATAAPVRNADGGNPWIEIVDDPDPVWLHERLFHYDVVVLADRPSPELDAVLRGTQPQAARMSLRELAGEPTDGLLDRFSQVGLRPGPADG